MTEADLEGQKNLEVLVGTSTEIGTALTCGLTPPERISMKKQRVTCSPGPIFGQYVTVRTTEEARLILGTIEVIVTGYQHHSPFTYYSE